MTARQRWDPFSPNGAAHPQTRARNERFGEVVRAERLARGWTQEMLADKLDWNRATITRLELGKFSCSLHRLFQLADALGLPAASLVAAAESSQPAGAGGRAAR